MTGPEFKAIREKAGLTALQLSQELGCTERTVRRYESGGFIPYLVAKHMEALNER